jgi:hypothetical protein
MPSISMQELVRSVMGSASVAQPSHLENREGSETTVGRRRKQQRRSSETTKTLIKEFMARENRAVTMLEICTMLNREPAPHFRAFMREMEQSGEIEKSEDNAAGPSIPRFLYTLKR